MIRKIFNKTGINSTIIFSITSRVVQGIGGVVTIFLIAKFLSKEEQGYYFTFGSLVAIQIFFELGLNNIITQFVAHEMSNINISNKFDLEGETFEKSRISSILHFCIKLFSFLSIVLLLLLLVIGFIYFKSSDNVNWKFPWILLSISTSLMLFINPVLAFIEGLNEVKKIAKIRLFQQTGNLLILILFFFLNKGLYALGIANLSGFFIIFISLFFSNLKKLLLNIYNYEITSRINYVKEIFPYQWKIALSWISGYFIFQILNPVLFKTEGPIIAGKMGITLAALTGISSISITWITTKVPLFSKLIAQKKFLQLDEVFYNTIKQLISINLFLFISFNLFIYFASYLKYDISSRFLPIKAILLLSIIFFTNQIITALATYLRCHKKEPLLINSIVGAFLNILIILILGKINGLYGIVYGYFFTTIFIGFPWVYMVFQWKKQVWHK